LSLPPQKHLQSALRRAALQGTLHHAYLFAGPAGIGKADAALWLAQLANCEGEGEQPCGECRSCRLIAAGSHPDVQWVGPSEKSKSGKILIEQAQAVRTEVSRRPVLGRRKIVVLAPADELTLDAVNCLLKTLEEPPHYATLVLLVADTANVLPTVLSRCQVARFQPIPEDEIAEWLRESGADMGTAGRLAALAGGRPGEALRLLEDAEALPRRERALEWLDSVAGAAPSDALRLAEQLRGEDVRDMLYWAETWFRDILAMQCGVSGDALLNRDHLPTLQGAAERYRMDEAQAAMTALPRARRFLAGNGAPHLVADVLLMDLIPGGSGA
jgi:DNA polymerase-3 subunit delta'